MEIVKVAAFEGKIGGLNEEPALAQQLLTWNSNRHSENLLRCERT
jgi:hypothetical protein